ncbi:hypothetical protein D6774_02740 [Candidatus Woesearchaeota archaeon]|nr:MAG: hypothetical protein D6774_02740 [Candidatus Woesearchaeota archaeon]
MNRTIFTQILVICLFLLTLQTISAQNNVAPILDEISNLTLTEGIQANITFHATDADNDTLTYAKNIAFANETFNASSGLWTFTPNASEVGVYTVLASVGDGNNGTDSQTFTITVTSSNTTSNTSSSNASSNTAPQIAPIEDQIAIVNTTFTYQVIATDAENDTLNYSSNVPIDQSGLIEYVPLQVQTKNITVTVCDYELCTIESFLLQVSEDPFAQNNNQNNNQTNQSNQTQQEQAMRFKDITVEVDGNKDSSANENGGTIDKDVKPGSTVSFEMEIENLLDIDIEDVEITLTVYDIDDGDDIEEDTEIDKIRDGKDESATLSFKVPLELDEDSYDVRLVAEGEDEEGNSHEISVTYTLEIDKDDDDIRILNLDLDPQRLSCNRQTSLDLEIINVGEDDQEDVKVKVFSTALGIREERTGIDLEADPDDDNKWEGRFNIEISNQQKQGTYPLTVEVYYEDGSLAQRESLTVQVSNCAASNTNSGSTGSGTASSSKSSASTSGTDSSEVIVLYGGSTTGIATQPGAYAKNTKTTSAILNEESYTIILGALIILCLTGIFWAGKILRTWK